MKSKEFTITDDLLASQGRRFLNFSIDLVIIYIIILSIGTTLNLIAEVSGNYSLSEWVESLSLEEITVYSVLIMILYYGLTEMYFSRTLAKYFTKTIVVQIDGTKPDNKMILKRTLCRFIPFEFVSFLGSVPRGWHDTFSKTYVVKKHRLNEKMKLFYSFDEVAKI
jgi:uncharacterized RDD family membrane protein YckC